MPRRVTIVKGNPQLFFWIRSTRLHVVSSHQVTKISSVLLRYSVSQPKQAQVQYWIIYDENSKLSVYIRFKQNIKVKKISRHKRSLSSFLKSSDSGSFTSGLAGGHLYHLYSTFQTICVEIISLCMKKQLPQAFADIFLSKLLKFRRFKENVNFTSGSKWPPFKTLIFRT